MASEEEGKKSFQNMGESLRDFFTKDAQSRRDLLYYGKDVNEENADKTRQILNKVLSFEHSSPFVNLMMTAMADAGCAVNPDTHIAIEACNPHANLFGAFDPDNNQIVLCQNKFMDLFTRKGRELTMTHLLSHELVHAYDFCRAKVDFYDNPKHTMCSEIRAAALSGECMLKFHKLNSAMSGVKDCHQNCVRDAALRSFRALHPNFGVDKTANLMQEVFPSCYNDHEPFDRMPLTVKQAQMSYKAYLSRNRYSVN